MTNFKTEGDAYPVAYVAKNKQRIKQYDGTVYLKNKEEFQLEIFNPTQARVLAKIEINGISIGSGLILRPGERVFLERYINDAKKFLFETYEVEGKNKEVLKAIENNGKITVKFFKETMSYMGSGVYYPNGNLWYDGIIGFKHLYGSAITTSNCFYSSNIPYIVGITSNTATGLYGMNTTTTSTAASSGTLNITNNISKKSIETGRIEKGSNSDQKFETVDVNFEQIYSWISEWKLLPESRKMVVVEDVVQYYCSSCGRRKRDKERYCPACGQKF